MSKQNIKHIIAVASGKGGVGKSTITTNLAYSFALKGKKVGILDADIYGPSQQRLLNGQNLALSKGETKSFAPMESYGMKFVSMAAFLDPDEPVVWRAPMVVKIIQQFLSDVEWGDLDYLFIDMPPGTGDIQLTIAQNAHLMGAIIVTTPQEVAVSIAMKGLKMFEKVNVPILGVIENMSTFHCEKCDHPHDLFGKNGGAQLADLANTAFLGRIALHRAVLESGETGTPFLQHEEISKDPALVSIVSSLDFITKNLTDRIEKEENENKVIPDSIEILKNGNLKIRFVNAREGDLNHHGEWNAWTLRASCLCAGCVDENTGKEILKKENIPLDIKVTGYRFVGRYGIALSFSDTHQNGIYRLDRLREMCECEECQNHKDKGFFV